jgi:hypothetical protein
MDDQAVREYVEQAQRVLESSPQLDEANTKAAILQDFLGLLGWEIPDNTQLEYSVRAFGKTYKADYALIFEGAPVAFIEAKGVDTPLTDKHREQLAAYLKNEDVNWGILTNGEEYEFYRRRVVDSKVNVNALADTDLQDLPDRTTILRAFTEDAIQTGDSEKIATRINNLKQARTVLESEKDRLATEVTELFASEVSDAITSPAESQAKEMIDRLIQDIETEIVSDGSVSSGGESDDIMSNGPEDTTDVSREYVIKIQNQGTTLATLSDDNQSDVMADAVNHLIENHDLVSELEPLPYVPGRKNALINDAPTHPDGEGDMRTYRELTNGYYLFTSFNKRDKKRHVRRLAEKCGLDVEFEGGW